MQNVERMSITLPTEHLANVRSRIAEADADPSPSLSDDTVTRYFAERPEKSLKKRKDYA